MTKEQVLQVVDRYRIYLSLAGDKPELADFDHTPTRGEAIRHMLNMCDSMEKLLDEGRTEKAMRWLGFMQGVLWSQGSFSLNEMREHNIRPVS